MKELWFNVPKEGACKDCWGLRCRPISLFCLNPINFKLPNKMGLYKEDERDNNKNRYKEY